MLPFFSNEKDISGEFHQFINHLNLLTNTIIGANKDVKPNSKKDKNSDYLEAILALKAIYDNLSKNTSLNTNTTIGKEISDIATKINEYYQSFIPIDTSIQVPFFQFRAVDRLVGDNDISFRYFAVEKKTYDDALTELNRYMKEGEFEKAFGLGTSILYTTELFNSDSSFIETLNKVVQKSANILINDMILRTREKDENSQNSNKQIFKLITEILYSKNGFAFFDTSQYQTLMWLKLEIDEQNSSKPEPLSVSEKFDPEIHTNQNLKKYEKALKKAGFTLKPAGSLRSDGEIRCGCGCGFYSFRDIFISEADGAEGTDKSASSLDSDTRVLMDLHQRIFNKVKTDLPKATCRFLEKQFAKAGAEEQKKKPIDVDIEIIIDYATELAGTKNTIINVYDIWRIMVELHKGAKDRTKIILDMILQERTASLHESDNLKSVLSRVFTTAKPPNQEYEIKLDKDYHLVDIDSSSSIDSVIDSINKKCKETTKEKIKEAIDSSIFSEDFWFLFVIASLFDKEWENPFQYLTDGMPYQTPSGNIIQVPAMTVEAKFHYFETNGYFQAVALPYKGCAPKCKMIIIKPMGYYQPQHFGTEDIKEAFYELNKNPKTMVNIKMPTLDFSSNLELTEYISKLCSLNGDNEKISMNLAGEIRSYQKMRLQQKAHLKIDTEGTVMVSATTLTGYSYDSCPVLTVTFVLDRPSLYFVVEELSDGYRILFGGVLANPNTGAAK
ncbi:hypothetical protein ACH42_08055 [Endozoicomonas sp. (ex Bugula neritina AB1)]|nr:hypothetical protein ACH42_08055 [Endozoicomonas sp. (ex Bugula neritina AB1)]